MNKQPSKKVLISGAGIAGLAAAYWLHKYNFEVTVVERAETLRAGGYAIDVRGSAVDVLKQMGMYDEAAARDTNMKTVSFVDPKSNRQSTIDADTFGGRAPGDLEVPRGDLVQVMYAHVKDSVSWRFGDSVQTIEEKNNAVMVTFSGGDSAVYDLVIGADGVHSHTRQLVFGDEQPFLKPLGAQIAIATIPNFLALDHEEKLYAEVGKSVFVYSSNQQTAKALFLWSNKDAPLRVPLDQQKSALGQTYEPVQAWKVPQVLDYAVASDDFYLDTLATVAMPSYSQGNYVLLGDAGYCASPASGQGTSLALIGAYILAGELHRQDDTRQALASYESLMRPFAEQNQALAPMALQGMIMKNKFFIFVRDLMLRSPKLFNAMNKPVLDRIQKAAHMENMPRYDALTKTTASSGHVRTAAS